MENLLFYYFPKQVKHMVVGYWSPLKQGKATPPTTERESNVDNAKEKTTF
jgi:hypothetical protein